MRTLGFLLLVVGLAFAAFPATAQQTGLTSFTLLAKNPAFVWADEAGATNPTIEIAGGQQITVTVKNDPAQDGFHALQVGNGAKSADIESKGDETVHTFTAPTTGSVEYVCPYHPTTMKGTFRVAGSAPETGEKNESPGVQALGLGIAFLGAALVLRRK